jgi:hypothetical protein
MVGKESCDHEVADLMNVNLAVNPGNSPYLLAWEMPSAFPSLIDWCIKGICGLSTFFFQSHCVFLTIYRCRLKVLLFNNHRRNREIFRCNADQCGFSV